MQIACFKAYHFYVANQELYIKKKQTKTKSNQETNKQNKNTHTDKQSRFSYLTIPKLLLERNFTYLLTNSLGQGSAASLLTLGVLDLRPVDGSFLTRSDELRTSVALLLLSSTTAIKKEWNTVKASWDFQLRRSVTLPPTSSSTILSYDFRYSWNRKCYWASSFNTQKMISSELHVVILTKIY